MKHLILAIALVSTAGVSVAAPKQSYNPKSTYRLFSPYGCFASGGNCLPDVIVTARILASARAFDETIKAGKGAEYFRSGRWKEFFPVLADDPETLKVLQSGIPIYRIEGHNGLHFYIATRLSYDELVRRVNAGSKTVEGLDVCMPFRSEAGPIK